MSVTPEYVEDLRRRLKDARARVREATRNLERMPCRCGRCWRCVAR